MFLDSCDSSWSSLCISTCASCSHPTFIALHLLLQGLVYAEYTYEVFGYCQELEFSLPYLLLPYLLLSVNLVFFTLTCAANPGKSGARAGTAQASCS